MRFGHSEIRERFGEELLARGVDCFTVYVQDEWQPDSYIPIEVDPFIFYPETRFTGPPVKSFQSLVQRVLREGATAGTVYSRQKNQIVPLRRILVSDSQSERWLNPLCPVSEVYPLRLDDSPAPCVQNFVQREHISKTAIFVPDEPIHEGASSREILFLDSRNADWSVADPCFATDLSALNDLARRILEYAETISRHRKRSKPWIDGMRRAMRYQSQLMNIVQQESSGIGRSSPTPLYNQLLKQLWESCHDKNSEMLTSLHLLDTSCPAGLKLKVVARYPEDNEGTPNERIYSTKRYDTFSITMCTAALGRAHLIGLVDPIESPCIFLTPEESEVLRNWPLPEDISRQVQYFQVASNQRDYHPDRLVLRTETPAWDSLEARLRSSDSHRSLVRVVKKLRCRARWHYGYIFKQMTQRWIRGGSELCIPIIASDRVIGCVNIETDQPFAMTYAYIHMLTALSRFVGMAIVTRHYRELLNTIHDTTDTIHEPRGQSVINEQLNRFAKEVRSYVLSDSVDFLRPNPFRKGAVARIASSDPEVPAAYPVATSPWTEFVASHKCSAPPTRSFTGVVLVLAPDGSRTIKNALAIEVDNNPTPDGSEAHSEPSPSDLSHVVPGSVSVCTLDRSIWPSNVISERWERNNCPRLLIGLPLGPRDEPTDRADAVAWFAYRHPARVYAPSCNDSTELAQDLSQLMSCVQLLRSTAISCAPVPLAWKSSILARRTLRRILSHDGLSDGLGYIEQSLRPYLERRDTTDLDLLAWSAVVAEKHFALYKCIERAESLDDLVEDVRHVQTIIGHDVVLADLLNEAWHCAFAKRTWSNGPWPPPRLSSVSNGGTILKTHCIYLFHVFYNIFVNLLRYGTSSPNISVTIKENWTTIVIADTGSNGYFITDKEIEEARSSGLADVLRKGLVAIWQLSKALGAGTEPELDRTSGTAWILHIRQGK